MAKRNQIFQYMQAIAILMVVDNHTGYRLGMLNNIFPYNSFYMPLFVFISGYFYHSMPFISNIIHKAKRLIVPYAGWVFIGELVSYALLAAGIVDWYKPMSHDRVIYAMLVDSTCSITGALWFVVMLFWVSISYNIVFKMVHYFGRSILPTSKSGYNDLVVNTLFLVLVVIGGCLAVYLCMHGYHKRNIYYLAALRTIFYLQFFHLGYYFHRYLETYIQRFNRLIVCLVCVGINVTLGCFYNINFPATVGMNNFHSWILPVITSMTGILFWYEVSFFLSSKIGERKEINFLAENTYTVMATHTFFMNIPKFYIYYRILSGE